MITRSKCLELDEVQAGMVLAEAVVDSSGNVLLPDATELTASMLASLSRRGIDSICIVDDSAASEDEKARLARVTQRLAHLFRKHRNQDDAAGSLQHRIAEYRAEVSR